MNKSIIQKSMLEMFVDIIESDVEKQIDFLKIELEAESCYFDDMSSFEITEMLISKVNEMDFDDVLKIAKEIELTEFNLFILKNYVQESKFKKPCKKPCPQCPYLKNSLSGYFGGEDPAIYANAISQDTVVACHTRTKHDPKTNVPKSLNDVSICVGHLLAQIKTCKSSRHPDAAKAIEGLRKQDNITELLSDNLGFDFKSHHKI